jgi:Protein of unknown function (DUF3617)
MCIVITENIAMVTMLPYGNNLSQERTLYMLKTHFTAAAVIMLCLAGCGAKSDPNKREPGKWKTEMTLVGFDMTGVPAGMEAQMAQMKPQIEAAMTDKMKSSGIQEQCLTAQQSAAEDISAGLTTGLAQAGSCKESKKNVSDGKIEFAATCSMAGQSVDIAMDGTIAPKKVDALMNFKAAAAAGKPGMDMKIKVVATHLGTCTA